LKRNDGFPIRTNDLLAVCDDTRFARRGSIRQMGDAVSNPFAFEQTLDFAGEAVGADCGDELHARTERNEIARYVPRAAQRERMVVHRNDRHGRLGRYA
jgi:hypothetical protein